jgi:hypothetical protein
MYQVNNSPTGCNPVYTEKEHTMEKLADEFMTTLNIDSLKRSVESAILEIESNPDTYNCDDHLSYCVEFLIDDCNGMYMANRAIDIFDLPEHLTNEYKENESGALGNVYNCDIWEWLIEPFAELIAERLNEQVKPRLGSLYFSSFESGYGLMIGMDISELE